MQELLPISIKFYEKVRFTRERENIFSFKILYFTNILNVCEV